MGKHSIYKNTDGRRIILEYYEKYLVSFEEEFERIHVETSFGRTHVLVGGPLDGKPVFIFQGGNCINPMTLSWFRPLLRDYRVYAPDTIGHPGYSAENRISASDDSFARWISDLMAYFGVERAAFVGPSYGAGIILRLATFMPEKIACSVLVSPAGIQLGSKVKMVQKILVPMLFYMMLDSRKSLDRIGDVMSDSSMKELDREIIGSIFKYTRLEQEMPKLTEKSELAMYAAPTMVVAGRKDVFFPEERIGAGAKEIIPNLVQYHALDMGHFPSAKDLEVINREILEFLRLHY